MLAMPQREGEHPLVQEGLWGFSMQQRAGGGHREVSWPHLLLVEDDLGKLPLIGSRDSSTTNQKGDGNSVQK